MNEHEKLQHRWTKSTGDTMPESIARLPLDRIRRAVELTEAGQHVFVPSAAVAAEPVHSGSMMEWDSMSNY
jgi:hypothetical protein